MPTANLGLTISDGKSLISLIVRSKPVSLPSILSRRFLQQVPHFLQANTIVLNSPEKNSYPRIFSVSTRLMGMLQSLTRKGNRVFGNSNYVTKQKCLQIQKKRLAEKLNNPRLERITFHTFRHWKGTMEYHKTHDILHVKKLLGHKNIENTLQYINTEQAVFQTRNDEFHVKVAETLDEACKLLEVGFEYVTEIDGTKLFRKRK